MAQSWLCCFVFAFTPNAIAQALRVTAASPPIVLYTDLASGPTTGGENNRGTYLSVFGKHFGNAGLGSSIKVFIGGVEVDNYRYLGPSKGRSDVQQITVQVGALGNPARGQPLPVKVEVNGVASNEDKTFVANPGRIFFVDNVSGNDRRGAPDDIARPFRHVQTADWVNGDGVWPRVAPGDVIVLRGRGVPWTDIGAENYFMRVAGKSGTKANGKSHTGPITLMAYPGEDVYIKGSLAGQMSNGCISAVNGDTFPGAGQWATISGLRIDCEGYDGPINTEIRGDGWRVVNNDLSASSAPVTGPSVPRMGGIAGNGQEQFWVGNHIHDIQGSPEECHGIYVDGGGSYEIAYNLIERILSGNGIQAYDNQGSIPTIDDVRVHHNMIRNVSKHGLNIADGSGSGWQVYNNVIADTARAGIRFNSTNLKGARIYNNTFFGTNRSANPLYGALTNDWFLQRISLDIQNNIFVVFRGTPYTSGTVGITSDSGTFRSNLWFGGTGDLSFEPSAYVADPLFVSAGSDLHLTLQSPAVHRGSLTVRTLVLDDYDADQAREAGRLDIGAYAFP